jgi:hypothetical protein
MNGWGYGWEEIVSWLFVLGVVWVVAAVWRAVWGR